VPAWLADELCLNGVTINNHKQKSVKNSRKKTKTGQSGFTIIEIMIVLAIASLIMLLVFEGVTQLQRNRRDAQRKSYARQVLAALIDYESNNLGRQVNCYGGSSSADCAAAPAEATKFITNYMSTDSDPSTGDSYRSDTTDNVSTPYCNGIATPSQSTVYCWNDRAGSYVSHMVQPDIGQIYIVPVHFCGTNASDPSSAGSFGDQNIRDSFGTANGNNPHYSVSVLIGTESGEFYCINS
jgi:prepilin-type N-terminal cleavage/methylation domain-containing protein